jgi:TetR/AcrR family transcriptional regulator, transcriptional repressor of bet genes
MRIPTVDHDERRRRIAEVTVDVIAREGLEAATIRRIAAELNGPTKLVTHYFADKDELLVLAYQALAEQGQEIISGVVARDPSDILGVLFAMTPADDKQAKLWRVYLAFWDRATRDPAIAALQRKHIDLALCLIAQVVRARNGERANLQSVSERLNAMVHGIAIQALVDRGHWLPERLHSRLAEEVTVLLGGPRHIEECAGNDHG